MADCAHSTPAPAVQQLDGSTPPGAGRPAFRPTSPSRPAPRPRPPVRPRLDTETDQTRVDPHLLSWLDEVGDNYVNYDTHPERDLMRACLDAGDIVERDEAAWTLVADNHGDEAILEAARASSEAVRIASQRIAALPARTPEGLAAKATVLQEACFDSKSRFIDVSDHEDLLKSILDDARFIGSRGRFTVSRLLGMEMDAPVRVPEEGWNFRHLMADWANSWIDDEDWFDMVCRLGEANPAPEWAPALMVQENDAKLFAVSPAVGHVTDDGRRFYSGSSIDQLKKVLDSDQPSSISEHNQRRRARAREIVDAHRDREVAIERIARDSGLNAAKAAMDWEISRQRALRVQVIATPVHTLDGLLAKALVFSVCHSSGPGEAAEEVEAELLKEVSAGGASDEEVANSLLLDLLRLCVRRRMSVAEVAGRIDRPREKLATAAERAA